jgi:hypothetical protein
MRAKKSDTGIHNCVVIQEESTMILTTIVIHRQSLLQGAQGVGEHITLQDAEEAM